MKRLRALLLWSMAGVAVWLVVCAVIGVFAGEWALHPGRRALGQSSEAQAKVIAVRYGSELADVSLTADDSVVLRGWSIRPRHGNGDVVLLLHGQSDNRMGMLGNAEMLLQHGFAVVMPDARAHGESGGDLATYGVKEAGDVKRWFDWIERAEAPRCIDGMGESMGAAQLLESLISEPGFCAVVAESPFASFREASYDRLGQEVDLGAWAGRTLLRPAVTAGFIYARWKYGVDLEKASPESVVSASVTPVLLIHGLRDTNLPSRHSEEIAVRSSARKPTVALWEPAEAGHCGAVAAEPQEFERRVIGWLESNDKKMDR